MGQAKCKYMTKYHTRGNQRLKTWAETNKNTRNSRKKGTGKESLENWTSSNKTMWENKWVYIYWGE